MKVILHPAAAADVEGAAAFYERTGSPALAAKFVAEFKRPGTRGCADAVLRLRYGRRVLGQTTAESGPQAQHVPGPDAWLNVLCKAIEPGAGHAVLQ
jgi:plasmid stabilization system protein ParE